MLTGIKSKKRLLVLYREDIHRGNLILVNRQYPINDQFKDLEALSLSTGAENQEIILEKSAANMLTQLIRASKAGNLIVPISSYRSLKEQQRIFSESIRENGEEFTFKYVALPNHSEHQTGLAVDVAEKINDIDFICPSFPYEGICQEFRTKAARYGFIERYQQGKEAITGIAHEPWHFRYVGYPHSEIIEKNKFSLEEYMEYLKGFQYGGKHLFYRNGMHDIEIFYMEMQKETCEIYMEEYVPYQVSGNNSDGLIITVWKDSIWRDSHG